MYCCSESLTCCRYTGGAECYGYYGGWAYYDAALLFAFVGRLDGYGTSVYLC